MQARVVVCSCNRQFLAVVKAKVIRKNVNQSFLQTLKISKVSKVTVIHAVKKYAQASTLIQIADHFVTNEGWHKHGSCRIGHY